MKRNKGKFARRVGRQVDKTALSEIRELLGDDPRRRDLLIEYLHRIQDRFGHIAARHIIALGDEMKLAIAEIYEVATFYHHFDVVGEHETPPPALTVGVCESVTCELFGAQSLITELKQQLGASVRVRGVPCVGRCHGAPVAVVGQNALEYASPQTVLNAVNAKAITPSPTTHINYDDYCKAGGYDTYRACVNGDMAIDAVLDTLTASNLRGLGGAGFPAGRKWQILRQQAHPRLVAINIDEGEPGTFKDRYYLERDPHRFIEGTLIASWAIEAQSVYLYIRDEYTACRKMLEQEIARLQDDPPVAQLPSIHLRRGAGAYICGEESAMIESLEGKRGMPRLRPPYLAEVGLFGHPTLEHNMETMHWIREILEKGGAWFASHGRRDRQGLRSFSVSGRIKRPGVHLAPAGITARELIDEYCEGMLDGHTFHAYFPGGASGGILPASLGDIPLDFDTLQAYGCFIGSAAVIILSDQDSVKQAALNTMKFFSYESCGQCTPCRVGTIKATDLMARTDWNESLLDDLATVMEDASICGLGQAAPGALRSVFKYFPEELPNGNDDESS